MRGSVGRLPPQNHKGDYRLAALGPEDGSRGGCRGAAGGPVRAAADGTRVCYAVRVSGSLKGEREDLGTHEAPVR